MQSDIFTEYVRKYSAAVYRAAYSCTQSRPDSEDIMQDAFLKLYQSGKSFRDDEHVKAWLLRVAINRARDIMRSSWKKQTDTLETDVTVALPQHESSLDEAMSALSEDYRLAVYLHYYEGYGIKEMSRIMGISESNVKIRLKRARDKLKEFLTDT